MNETPGSTEGSTTEHNLGPTSSRTAASCAHCFSHREILSARLVLSCNRHHSQNFWYSPRGLAPRWASTPPTQCTAVPRKAQQSFHGQTPACSYSLIWKAIGMPLSFSGRGVADRCLSKNGVYLPLTCLTCWRPGSGVQLSLFVVLAAPVKGWVGRWVPGNMGCSSFCRP